MLNLAKIRVNISSGLTDQTAAAIRSQVTGGAWLRGARIPTEAALVSDLGVSRTVVREAVSRLKSEGLLTSRQGAGVYVATEDVMRSLKFADSDRAPVETVTKIVELRRALDGEAAALAAIRATALQRKQIARALKGIEIAVRAKRDGVAEDLAFHQAIASAADNPYLEELFGFVAQYLRDAMRVTRANEAQRAEFMAQVIHEHQEVVAAIEAGDAERARRAAVGHMNNAMRRLGEGARKKGTT